MGETPSDPRRKDTTMRSFALLTVALGLASAGCSADLCPKLYDKLKECAPEEAKSKMPEKKEFVDKCEADRKKEKDEGKEDVEAEKAMAACLDQGECDAMQKCMEEESEKRYTKKQVDEIAAAKASGDVAKMKDACQYVNEENKTLVDACKEVMVKLLEATSAEVTKMRDEGKHDYGVCGDLEGFAKAVGGDAEATAKALCTEAQASETVAKALTESAAKIAAKEADMPYECGAALEELGKIDSEWAKGKKGEVVKACYQDLGLVIMEVKIPEMKYVCDFRVKEIYKAVKDHGIKDAKMDEWIAKADPLCSKEDG